MFDYAKMNDAAAIPVGFGLFADFIRQDEIADGGAFDGTAINSGTIATNAANGGHVRLSGAATTDNSGYQLQALGGHVFTAGKFVCFKCRAQVNESTSTNGATDSDLFMGLFPVDTSIEASLPDNGIYFVKADGGTTITCIVRVAGSNAHSQTIPAATFAFDKSMHTYGIGVFPNGTDSAVEFIIDGEVVSRASGISLPASTVICTPSLAFQTGDNTGTKWVDVDYIGSFQER